MRPHLCCAELATATFGRPFVQAASAQAVASDGSGQVRARCHGGPCDHRCRSTNCCTATETHSGHRVAGAHMRRQQTTGRWRRCHGGSRWWPCRRGRRVRSRVAVSRGRSERARSRRAAAGGRLPDVDVVFARTCPFSCFVTTGTQTLKGTYSLRGRRSDSTSLRPFNSQRCGAAPALSYPGRAEAAR